MIDIIAIILMDIVTGLLIYWAIFVVRNSSRDDRALDITFIIITSVIVIAIGMFNYMVIDLHYMNIR
jgi:hypothetical protein